jgi:hypothetical protein
MPSLEGGQGPSLAQLHQPAVTDYFSSQNSAEPGLGVFFGHPDQWRSKGPVWQIVCAPR